MKDLSDPSFLGKLLVLSANVRLDWKVIARYKHLRLFGLVVSNEEKKFITLTIRKGFSIVKKWDLMRMKSCWLIHQEPMLQTFYCLNLPMFAISWSVCQ